MAISKRKVKGKTVYDVFVKGRDKTGRQVGLRRRSISSEREAKRIEFDLRVELEGFKSKVSWAKWTEHFLERYRVEYRNSTYVNYKNIIEKWVSPSWEKRFIDEITPSEVYDLVHEQIVGVSSHFRHGIAKVIKRVFQMAVEEGVLNRNPAVGIKVKTADANQKVLNKSELNILLKQAKSVQHRFYYHWAFAILTGMRSGEMHCLRWTDVDLEGGFIKISKSWTRLNGEGPTKTSKNRVCPISKECRKLLQELKIKSASSPYVLPRLWEWDHGVQAAVLRDFCKGIGISPVAFHDLRATFITQMLNNGAPLAKVMAIVGHSSLKTTQGYLRLCGKDVEGATEALEIQLPDAVSEAKVLEFSKNS